MEGVRQRDGPGGWVGGWSGGATLLPPGHLEMQAWLQQEAVCLQGWGRVLLLLLLLSLLITPEPLP